MLCLVGPCGALCHSLKFLFFFIVVSVSLSIYFSLPRFVSHFEVCSDIFIVNDVMTSKRSFTQFFLRSFLSVSSISFRFLEIAFNISLFKVDKKEKNSKRVSFVVLLFISGRGHCLSSNYKFIEIFSFCFWNALKSSPKGAQWLSGSMTLQSRLKPKSSCSRDNVLATMYVMLDDIFTHCFVSALRLIKL